MTNRNKKIIKKEEDLFIKIIEKQINDYVELIKNTALVDYILQFSENSKNVIINNILEKLNVNIKISYIDLLAIIRENISFYSELISNNIEELSNLIMDNLVIEDLTEMAKSMNVTSEIFYLKNYCLEMIQKEIGELFDTINDYIEDEFIKLSCDFIEKNYIDLNCSVIDIEEEIMKSMSLEKYDEDSYIGREINNLIKISYNINNNIMIKLYEDNIFYLILRGVVNFKSGKFIYDSIENIFIYELEEEYGTELIEYNKQSNEFEKIQLKHENGQIKLSNNINNIELILINKSEKNKKYKYIDKYLELSKLAVSNGYKLIRNNGDHGIFKNKKSKKIVVIPQGRRIGKGLSIVIQKQLLKKI